MRVLGRAAAIASRRLFTPAKVVEAKFPPLLHIDAFTRRPFAGNPAAVVLLEEAADTEWMLLVARNQNLPETAFVRPLSGAQLDGIDGAPAKGESFELRWFTPSVEVDLCGHATLAAAHALFTCPEGRESDVLRFSTRSGELQAVLCAEGLIELAFPASPPIPLNESVGPVRTLKPLEAPTARLQLRTHPFAPLSCTVQGGHRAGAPPAREHGRGGGRVRRPAGGGAGRVSRQGVHARPGAHLSPAVPRGDRHGGRQPPVPLLVALLRAGDRD